MIIHPAATIRVSASLKMVLSVGLLLVVWACGPVDVAERTETVSRTLTVRDIDRETRQLTVAGGGERFTLRASEDVRNFDQIAVGDKVNIEFIESIALEMAAPADTGEAIALGGAAIAAEGQKPAAAVGGVVSGVVQFLSYDRSRQTVVFRTLSGDVFTTKVAPEMRNFAASREPGDRVVVTYSTGLAVSVTPAA